jgi:hypothetical protein
VAVAVNKDNQRHGWFILKNIKCGERVYGSMLLLWGLCFCNQSRGRVERERERREKGREKEMEGGEWDR